MAHRDGVGNCSEITIHDSTVTLEPTAVESDEAHEDEVGYDSVATIHDSNESGPVTLEPAAVESDKADKDRGGQGRSQTSQTKAEAKICWQGEEAKISAVDATATKIRRIDEWKKAAAVRSKEWPRATFPRQPVKNTEVEEKEGDRTRFIELLAQLTKNCRVSLSENASATDKEVLE